jgi:hypothetical protein
MARHDDVRTLQSTAGSRQASKQRDTSGEWRIGDDAKWSTRQSNVAAVSSYHHDIVVDEPLSKFLSARGMEFEGNDPSASA